MNKAEEQYLYRKGRIRAEADVMEMAYSDKASTNIPAILQLYCKSQIGVYKQNNRPGAKGMVDYYNSILNAIKLKLFTDWPSFVTYMTGETYDS